MSLHHIRESFNGGELSPLLDGQHGLDKTRSGCRVMRNWFPRVYGPAFRRPGLCFADQLAGWARIEGFLFSTDTVFLLELAPGVVRVRDEHGVRVGSPEIELATPWTTQAQVRELHLVQINDVVIVTHPAHRPRRIVRMADDEWAIDELPNDYPALRDPNVSPGLTITSTDTRGSVTLTADAPAWSSPHDYKLDDVVLVTGQFYRCPIPHTSGSFSIDLANGKWEPITVFAETNVGGWFELTHTRESAYRTLVPDGDKTSTGMSVLGGWNVYTFGTFEADIEVQRSYDGTTWKTVRTFSIHEDRQISHEGYEEREAQLRIRVSNYVSHDGATKPRVTLEVANAARSGIVRITEYLEPRQVVGVVEQELESTDPTDDWAESSWSDRRGWPRAVELHEQRLVFGGNLDVPNGIWGSRTGDFYNFRRGTSDDDGLLFILASRESNPINWMVSQQGLLIGTTGSEWAVTGGGSDDAITPTNVKVRRQSKIGGAFQPAEVVGDVVVFAQRTGHKLRALSFDFAVKDGWRNSDLTIFAEHMLREPVIQMSVQQQPELCLWAVTEDGVLRGLTVDFEQQVVAWHRHDTDGHVESVGVVYGTSPSWDRVFVVVRRVINGQTRYYLEFLDDLAFHRIESGDRAGMVYVDSAIKLTRSASTEVTGLDHLEGKTVSVLTDGASHPNRVVEKGAITLAWPAATVVVGLPYESVLQPTRLEVGMADGSAQGRSFRVNRIVARLWESAPGLQVCHDPDGSRGWDAFVFRAVTDAMDAPPPLQTGDVEAVVNSDHGFDISLALRHTEPTPCNVVALVTKFTVNGS